MSLRIIRLSQLPEKLKGTIFERWINYWKGLGRDYKEVSKDCVNYIKANPVRSTIYGSIGTFAFTCYKTNPTFNDFTDQVRTSENLVALVHPDCQNPHTIQHLRYLEKCRNDDKIRLTSLWLFSIVWIHDFPSKLATADATCKYLQPEYATFHERIIDIGFFNKFWNLEKKMKDYDIFE
ncbi:hypothetical protein PVAND_011097 [Polypedilum vanderplanki]|uniref:Mitochondrial import inner membrane translocase subunit Tim29 n=1 Tax=Polypedilum vanderplanki TaxID=319348 RepID=A0A9J6CI99_POLVA|nr:hypothetical protein PVAND_011097 [Polypedilum vanderplanki]